jgi:outer membrane protein assembly factor BamB
MNTNRRVLALVLGAAIGFVVPVPAHAARMRPHVVWSTPMPNGPAYLATDPDGAVVTTNLDDVVALDPRGRTAWRTKVGPGAWRAALDGNVVAVATDGQLATFNRATGAPGWTATLPAGVARAVAGAGIVLATTGPRLLAFDAATGAPRWGVDLLAEPFHRPVIDAEHRALLVVDRGYPEPMLRVLDLDTGALRWTTAIDRSTAVPVAHGGRVFVAMGDGWFHALVMAYDLADGTLQWGRQVPASFEPGIVPAVDDRSFVVTDHHGRITALDPDDGDLQWERSLDRTVLTTGIVLERSRAVVSSAEQDLTVLDRANGRVVRHVTPVDVDGWPVDFAAAAGPRDRLVVAIRLGDHERIEAWRLH